MEIGFAQMAGKSIILLAVVTSVQNVQTFKFSEVIILQI